MCKKHLSRRCMLATVGAAGLLSGCVSTSNQEPEEPTDEPTEDEETASEQDSDVIYVDPDGDNGDPGTSDEPLQTIQQALTEVQPDETIFLRPGEYTERVATVTAGEPDKPITVTGPKDAVIRPSKEAVENHFHPIHISHSHYRLTGITINGLQNPESPGDPDSYAERLLHVSPSEDASEYIEDVVVAPYGIGNSQKTLINTVRLKDCEFGPFKVIGPAGVEYLYGDKQSHVGEILYLGSPLQVYAEDIPGYVWNDYDKTRNIHVHHIDNSEGYHHSELVDCKDGTSNITIEYCTDAGGSENNEPYGPQSIHVRGHDCTIRWNRLANGAGNGIEVYKPGQPQEFPEYGFTQEVIDRIATDNEIYGNEIYNFGNKAIAFDEETRDAQRVVCGNVIQGDMDGSPEESCSADLPNAEGIGHTGGDSPWA